MVVLGGEPVRVDGAVVGRVTSGGFGYTVRKSIAYGYLPVDRAAIGTEVAVDIFGEWVPGRVAPDQLHDPRGDSIRSLTSYAAGRRRSGGSTRWRRLRADLLQGHPARVHALEQGDPGAEQHG